MNGGNRTYNKNGYYSQMSHLPFSAPPTGWSADSLGWLQNKELECRYPPHHFNIGNVPISCPPSGIRIYETGNAENPNVYSVFGVVHPDEIRF